MDAVVLVSPRARKPGRKNGEPELEWGFEPKGRFKSAPDWD
jgi:hypothetical protein